MHFDGLGYNQCTFPPQRVWELADDCVHQDDRRLVDLQLAQAVHRHYRPDLHRVLEGGGQYKGVLWFQNFEAWFSIGWGGAIRKTSLDWWGKCWKWSKASFQGGVDKNLLFVPSCFIDTKISVFFMISKPQRTKRNSRRPWTVSMKKLQRRMKRGSGCIIHPFLTDIICINPIFIKVSTVLNNSQDDIITMWYF